MTDPNVFKNLKQLEPSFKYFFNLVERNSVLLVPLAFSLKDSSETRRRLAELVPSDYLTSIMKSKFDLNQVKFVTRSQSNIMWKLVQRT